MSSHHCCALLVLYVLCLSVEDKEVELNETVRKHEFAMEEKKKTISEQGQKMEEMAVEFGEMLRETLDKMTERIELVSRSWESKASVGFDRRRLEEFGLAGLFTDPGEEL